jgi:His/Glu/Gln/Arg/opine family amino acid ABC transporter permease subunit
MPGLLEYAPAFFRGLLTTAFVGAVSIVCAAVLSIALGLLRRSPRRSLRFASLAAVEVFRGASALVFLFWVYYALPLLPGMPKLDPMVASILVLSLVGGAYGCEIVRAGIDAIDRGQHEACRALGLSNLQAMRRVVVPQAMSQIVPAFSSLAADIVKWTSIVSFVGVQDVLHVANAIRGITYETVSVFSAVAATYWLLCLITSLLFRAVERGLPLNRALRAGGGGASRRPAGPVLPEAPR